MPFGQLVIGPPGSGKSTFCTGVTEFLRGIGREVAIINLDPANDDLPYDCAVDVSDLVSLAEVQEQMGLGPNGGLIYCIDYLASNMDWLKERLTPLARRNVYLIFDCPGQAELHMSDEHFHKVVTCMTQQWSYSLAAVQLVDSHLCTAPHKFLSALLMCLSSMLHLEMPHVNLLSKVDLLEHISEDLPVNVDAYTDLHDLQALLHSDESTSTFSARYAKLTSGLCELIEDFGLLSLAPVSVQDKASMANALDLIDRANGYFLSGLQGSNPYSKASEGDVDRAALGLSSTHIWEGEQLTRHVQ